MEWPIFYKYTIPASTPKPTAHFQLSELNLPASLFVVLAAVAALPVELSLELPVVATSAATVPADVNASPWISTTVLEPCVLISVLTCLFASFVLKSCALVASEVKQNSSELRPVVAQPFGQQTLVDPLTEKVVYPLVWQIPLFTAVVVRDDEVVTQPTRENTVTVEETVMVVGVGVIA
jgi:hypothetical protein